MEKLSKLLQSGKKSPRLWMARINIYSSPSSENLVRAIGLDTGINIICAEELSTGVHASSNSLINKSLSQLIRYCLADTTKVVADLCKELQQEFPNGGVGAVVHLGGKVYSVFRFFNLCREGWMSD